MVNWFHLQQMTVILYKPLYHKDNHHHIVTAETLHICSTLPSDVHEGIWLLSKI
jgi:hypothetical protein